MKLSSYTTRIDTIFGVTFMSIAPEHALVEKITKPAQKQAVQNYLQEVKNKSDLERETDKEKTGVFTGSYVKHPLTDANIPIWVADYVLNTYGSGFVMAVPAHDQRDFDFAKKFNLKTIPVIKPADKTEIEMQNLDKAYTETSEGVLINSGKYNGLSPSQAIRQIGQDLIKNEQAKPQTNFKFRNWVFSRQRYWGEPFPLEYQLNNEIKN